MSIPDEPIKGVKTLGIRLKPDVHAQLSFIAQLRDGTITDEIQLAIATHIEVAKGDAELRGRADAARASIEAEAAARQQAIATLFAAGSDALSETAATRTGRRPGKAGDATPDS